MKEFTTIVLHCFVYLVWELYYDHPVPPTERFIMKVELEQA